ncbi:MAG TPA: cytochrome c-type biogenesis protein [Gaiellaceae bacterium]
MRTLAVLAAALVVGVPAALASESHPRLADLEGQLMCPTCKTPLDQSDAPAANRIRHFVVERINAGDTESEILDKLVVQFGPQVLAAPRKRGFDLLAWLLPLAGLVGGALVIGVLAWRWSRAREPAPAGGAPEQNGRVTLEPELERRVDEELARFE